MDVGAFAVWVGGKVLYPSFEGPYVDVGTAVADWEIVLSGWCHYIYVILGGRLSYLGEVGVF